MNISKSHVIKLVGVGGVLGLVLSFVSHQVPAVLAISAPLGASISIVFGPVYGVLAPGSRSEAAAGGAVTGFGTALIGIVAGLALGDQAPIALAGCVGGAVGGAVGGLVGKLAGARKS